jgi:DNA-nicking Smr family endonuclease
MGNCLAGDTCIFSHDPAMLVNNLNLGAGDMSAQNLQPSFQVQDYDAFPSLHSPNTQQWQQNQMTQQMSQYNYMGPQARNFISPSGSFGDSKHNYHNRSRPGSRHASRTGTPSIPAVDDTEAFPTLGSAIVKPGKKQHGKRAGGNKENFPSSLADVVRLAPAPPSSLLKKGLLKSKLAGSRENSAAANAIPHPVHIPWLETGDKANQAYLKARQDAFKHGGLRNKFLQSAAQAWNRNDARAAKALSLRGQSENDLMRKAHREAARLLYEERNKSANTSAELYVDLHGLHPEEAVEYLEKVLVEQQKSTRPVYAITGTGHHSKNGKDKVGKAVRVFLVDWHYAFREFSVPGDRGNLGGILGIDPKS